MTLTTKKPPMAAQLTARMLAEIIRHEGIVTEAYRDSVGVWTWSIGITNASGHQVHPRYFNQPQPLQRCLSVFVWLVMTRYLPAVVAAFEGRDLAEHQLAAALSFHYNTGAIARAEWVRLWCDGENDAARAAMLNWRKPKEILPRRMAEQALFFDGRWQGNGRAMIYDVAKPSYQPVRGRMIDIMPALEAAIAPGQLG